MPTRTHSIRDLRRPTLWLTVVAFVFQAGVLGLVYWRSGSLDTFAFRSLDCGEYYQIARNLVQGNGFSQSQAAPYEPDTWRTPGYPLFLAGLMALLGDAPSRLILAQQVLSIFNVILFHAIAVRYLTPRRAMAAALIFLVEPYRVYYSLWLMATTWFVTILLLAWHAWIRAKETKRSFWVVACGAAVGFLILVWPLAILLPVFLAGGMLIDNLRANDPNVGSNSRESAATIAAAKVGSVLIFSVSVLAVVGTWMARNHRVAGHFALSHQSGIVLAYFKATEVALWRDGRARDRYVETSLDPARQNDPHDHWDSVDARLRRHFADLPEEQAASLQWRNLAQGNRTPLDAFRISAELKGIALQECLAAPWSTLACCAVRVADNLTFPLSLSLVAYRGLESSSRWRHAVLGAVYAGLAAAALVGVLRGGGPRVHRFFPLAAASALLLAATPQVDPRFRAPVTSILVLMAWFVMKKPVPPEP